MAVKAQGTLLKIGDGGSPEIFTTVAEVRSFTGPGGSAAVIDTTNLSSTAKEKAMGLADEGELSLDMFWSGSDAGQVAMRNARLALASRNFQLVFPSTPAVTGSFAGFVSEFSISGGVDNVIEAKATIVINGAVTYA